MMNQQPPTPNASPRATTEGVIPGRDPHSYARPQEVRVDHMGLRWRVDFEGSRLDGHALLLLDRSDPEAPLWLDTRDLEILEVHAAKLDTPKGPQGVPTLVPLLDDPSFAPTTYALVDTDRPQLGAPLRVDLPAAANVVRIRYRSRPGSTGLQWLEPEQTAGKKHPFLYSQAQAIHARSFAPTQDGPGMRFTYDAEMDVPEGLDAVMAAEHLGPREGAADGQRRFGFVMPQRVPAYLLALAVGDLERREVGPRTAVYADPTVVEAAASEFRDMEAMLSKAESLYGPYVWGRYDVLVLPPAFPFGGMENPRLTFATPTVLAGDRSLVSLIAHELAHSWSGNLVTNGTWGDLWLNEGFTVYFERRIVEALYGEERAEMEALIGRKELEHEIEGELAAKPEAQKLRVDLRDRDPDFNFSSVPYEKGALLLRRLEETYGRETFDQFLRGWFERSAFGSVDTDEFITYATQELFAKHEPLKGKEAPDLDAWIEHAGLPRDAPQPDSDRLERVELAARDYVEGKTAPAELPTKSWTPHEWLHFLRALPEDLGAERMADLDAAFSLTSSGNSEILDQWLVLAARQNYEPAYDEMEAFLIRVGRRKYLTPVYRALAETEAGKERARAIYQKARPGYHAISRQTLDELLGAPPQ